MVERNGWVLEVPTMELMTKEEQFTLAGRTTVLVGVHGSEFAVVVMVVVRGRRKRGREERRTTS